jgi:hypothetical protein
VFKNYHREKRAREKKNIFLIVCMKNEIFEIEIQRVASEREEFFFLIYFWHAADVKDICANVSDKIS